MKKDVNLQKLKGKLSRGESVYGIATAFHSEIIIEMVGYVGFDYIFIDTQHSPIGSDLVLESLIRAAEVVNLVPIVRVKENEDYFIRIAIESGAKGIVIPRVSTKCDIEKAIKSAKFPTRHGNPSVRAAKYGLGDSNWEEYVKLSNDEVMIIPLVEDKKGIDNLDEIISVEGISAISFGPTDYALSLGLSINGGYGNPIIDEPYYKLLKAAKIKNIPVLDAFKPETAEQSRKLSKLGMTMQLVGSDKKIITNGLKSIMENIIKKVN